MRRGLLIVAKIIQNLANNIFFGKEAFMVVMNEYLREHIVTVTRYLSELNVCILLSESFPYTQPVQKWSPPAREELEEEWLGTSFDESDILVLHRFFESHIDKIGKEVLSESKIVDGITTEGGLLWTDLCEALVELSQPGDVPKPSAFTSSEHEAYLDLMDRFANRSTEPIREVFLEVITDKVSTLCCSHI
jgi:hypothetical protein